MKLSISQKTLDVWKEELLNAKHKEIGGVLFGEHVGDEEFRLIKFTTQRRRGGEASFKRKGREASRSLKRLSKAHGNDHSRFNYLGEWHSHPNAPAIPSTVDCRTMQSLLDDKTTIANFLVLMILRVNGQQELEVSASTFLASGHILECEIEIAD
ncbi:Mov34/MPN/PAD-1 family protein [Hyphomonas sp.]|uniref:Mov34/MPN/PAD-1 family protein n=1 Tax=Hyphomonas sp. TaxID=87 RepID=UPI0025B904F0|nr:Mov34/MPN/PAD-1 family protein [Hyphomonas sp.]